jgi:hypothetical protein
VSPRSGTLDDAETFDDILPGVLEGHRHSPVVDQGIEGSKPSSPANSPSRTACFAVSGGGSRQVAVGSVDAVVDAIAPQWNRLSDIEERGREDLRVTGPMGFHRHV